ncbi:LOB domain-containing protein 18-like protein [Cinnamomum micranthum f. kanehirae]|uniref:LOB domain-containing protein 18-like protein n=1 Tax=Cinnamomum micranthum f. kanehirae TaxID=337451 RepID=A0A443P7B1_9MAGN|nr:LOB domain-containing protein 18-like protein [Cinnamomum micranthum f. kanehirae]
MSVNGSTSSGGSSSSNSSGPCGACKFLRRKCVSGCIFAPYFDSEQGAGHFAAVHKVFGASNVSKLLLHIPAHKRLDAVVTICYEAQARLRDPVYGCVAHVFALQQQVVNLQAELAYMQAHLASLEIPSPPPLPPPPPLLAPPPLTISDLPPASTLPTTNFDLSMLFDSQVQPPWLVQQRQMDLRQQLSGNRNTPDTSMGGGDLQTLARELLHRHRSSAVPSSEPPLSK